MKNLFLAIAILFFASCKTVELESYVYNPEKDFKKSGIVYNLPKNFLKVEIVYTSRQEFKKVNGVDIKQKEFEPDVTIDKPIKVSSILMPDEDYEFRLTGKRISNEFFTKSTLDFNLTQNGILKSIDSEVEDKSVEFGESLIMTTANIARAVGNPTSQLTKSTLSNFSKTTPFLDATKAATQFKRDKVLVNRIAEEFDKLQLTLLEDKEIVVKNYDQELFNEIKKLNAQLIKTKKKDELTLITSKVKHLQTQVIEYQSKNKTFYKTTDVKYSVIIDPFQYYKRDVISTDSTSNGTVYKHKINPLHLFPDIKEKTIPEIKISISKDAGVRLKNSNPFQVDSLRNKLINGVVVRHPSSSKIDLDVNDKLYASEVVFLGQLGNTSILPVKVKRGGKVVTAIKFDPATGAIAQHKIEASSSSEKIGKSLVKSSKTLQETIDYLNYEKKIKELNAKKSELTLNNDIVALEDTSLDNQLANLTKEEQIITLQNKIKELTTLPNDNSGFETALNSLKQKQQLLELEIAIKDLENKFKE